MKNLLFFLLIFAGINCQAQEKTDTIFTVDEWGNRIDTLIFYFNNDPVDWSKYIDTTQASILISDYEIPITLGLLLDYQKECYNDSTLVAFETISDWDLDTIRTVKDKVPCYISARPVKGIYSHRHYPTFEGFIEYMKRKSR